MPRVAPCLYGSMCSCFGLTFFPGATDALTQLSSRMKACLQLKNRMKMRWNKETCACIPHSALIRNLIKMKGTGKLTAQDEQVCLKDPKYNLFEILENQTRKGCTSSCWPNKPDSAMWLAWLAGACTALPCPIC